MRHLPLLILLVGSCPASAQLVPIPDPVFRSMLQDILPGCITANDELDTEMWFTAFVGNANAVFTFDASPYVQADDTVDMTGFDALEFVHGVELIGIGPGLNRFHIPAYNTNTTLGNIWLRGVSPYDLYGQTPMWPASLYNVWITNGGMIGALDLPAWTSVLRLIDCEVDASSFVITPTLNQLWIDDSPVTGTLDLSAAQELEVLYMRNDGFATLPAIPPSVEELFVDGNPITTWSPFPAGLRKLFIGDCGLTELPPNIPETLEYLGVAGDPISQAIVLPEGLRFLDAANCGWSAPCALHEGLVYLRLRDNQLTDLGALPVSLFELDVRNNPDLMCLPAFGDNLDQLKADSTGITCLPVPFQSPYATSPPWLEDAICTVLNTDCPPVRCGVSGIVYHDLNASGAHDEGEPPYPMAYVRRAPFGTVAGVQADGTYHMGVLPGVHTFICEPFTPYVQSVSPATHSATFSSIFEGDSLNDFGVVLLPNVQDLVVDITAQVPPRPGFSSYLTVRVANAGTQVQAGTVSFTFDPLQNFYSSSPMPDQITGTTISWELVDLPVGGEVFFSIALETPASVPLETLLTCTATVGPEASDAAPADNVDAVTEAVVGSYDPNDKQVAPSFLTSADVLAGTPVEYTIRFQNTGTFLAERVVLTDTLSGLLSQLQIGTIRRVSASHGNEWYVEAGVLHVIFDNIMLPDSASDEPGSHGFFKFSITPSSDLLPGAVVGNVANIYFDANEPVITAPAFFGVEVNVTMNEVGKEVVQLYPNPASSEVWIEGLIPGTMLTLYDGMGRVVLRTSSNGARVMIDLADVPPGLFHVRCGSAEGTRTMRAVKR